MTSTNMTHLASAEEVQFILDGGALLQKIPWPRGSTYASIVESYVRHVRQRFGKPVIVFDGYTSGPSTKDITHLRRCKGKSSTDVQFTSDMTLQTRKDLFLANPINKQRFINLHSSELQKHMCKAVCCEGDADTKIVAEALGSAKSKATVVVGDDTDLLILLIHQANREDQDIFMQQSRHSATKPAKCWHIKQVQQSLGKFCQILPVIHAITGCDTTSRAFGIGKRTGLRTFLQSDSLCQLAQVFLVDKDVKDIVDAGQKILVALCDGKSGSTLDSMRYQSFCSKVALGTQFVQVHALPPTSAAAKYHSLRVYLQVQQWIGNTEVQPENWGWRNTDNKLLPITTDLPPAPARLLRVIRCNCKSDCDTKRCSCKKHGLDCSPACGEWNFIVPTPAQSQMQMQKNQKCKKTRIWLRHKWRSRRGRLKFNL